MRNKLFSKENSVNISIGRVAITIIMLVVVILGGTFAWLTYTSRKSALVLTIGDVHKTQIKLTPYEIKGNLLPSNNESGGVYSDVTVVNGRDEDTTVTLFYKVGEENTYSGDLKYKVVYSTVDGVFDPSDSTKIVSSGDFTPSETTDNGNEIVFSKKMVANKSGGNHYYYYRVYVWAPNDGDNSKSQGQTANIELNAAIGSSSIVGENEYGGELTANFKYSGADTDSVKPEENSDVSYQWYRATYSNGTLVKNPITGANGSSYVVQSGFVGYYMYVEASVGDEIVYSAVTAEPVQAAKITNLNLNIPSNITYSGNAMDFDLTTDLSDGTVDVKYYSDGSCTVEIDSPRNAGTYYVKGVVGAGDSKGEKVGPGDRGKDYAAAESNCTQFVIKPKTIAVSWGNECAVDSDMCIYDGVTEYSKTAAVDTGIYDEYMTLSKTSGSVNAVRKHQITASCASVNGPNIEHTGFDNCKNYTLSNNKGLIDVNAFTPSIGLNKTVININSFSSETIDVNLVFVNENGVLVDTCASGNITETEKTNTSAYQTTRLEASYIKYTGVGYATGAKSVVTYTPDDTNNCNTVTAEATVNVDRVDVDEIVLDSDTDNVYSGSYQGTNSKPVAKYNENSIDDLSSGSLSYTYTYYTNNTCTNKTPASNAKGNTAGGEPKNVGTYYVTATLGQTSQFNTVTSNCAQFSIGQYESTLSFNPTGGDDDSSTTEEDHDQLEIPFNDINTFKTTVKTIAACYGKLKVSNPTGAYVTVITSGDLTVDSTNKTLDVQLRGDALTNGVDIKAMYTPTDTANCKTVTVNDYTVRVVKRKPTIELTNKTATYTGAAVVANEPTITYNGTDVTDLDYTYIYYSNSNCVTKTSTSTGASSAGAAPVDAGVYYAKAFYTTTDDSIYGSASSNCARVTIDPKQAVVNWTSGQTSFVYNGSVQGPSVSSVATGISGENMAVNIVNSPVNVGTHRASVECASVNGGRGKCNNYKLSSEKPNDDNVMTSESYEYSITEYLPQVYLDGITGSINVDATSGKIVTVKVTTIAACSGYLNGMADGEGEFVASINTPGVTSGTDVSREIRIAASFTNDKDDDQLNISFVPTDSTNCKSSVASTKVIINRITPTEVTLAADTDNVYDNSYQTIGSTAVGMYNGTDIASLARDTLSYTYTYYTNNTCTNKTPTSNAKDGVAGSAPRNAGTYYVSAVLGKTSQFNSATSNCAEFKINKYQPTISSYSSSYAIVLDKQLSTAITVNTIASCVGTVNHTSTNSDFITLSTNPSNVGQLNSNSTFTLKVLGKKTTSLVVSETIDFEIVANTDNCNNASLDLNFLVNKKTPTVELAAKTETYTGGGVLANDAVVKYDENNDGDKNDAGDVITDKFNVDYTYYTNNSCSTKTPTSNAKDGVAGGAPINAGTYYVKATVTPKSVVSNTGQTYAEQYFAATSSCVKHTIDKKEISVTWDTSQTSFVYNGTYQGPLVTGRDTGIVGESIIIMPNNIPIDVGTGYTLTLLCNGVSGGQELCSNYNLSNIRSHEFSITPKPLQVTWNNTSLTYNGNSQKPTAIVSLDGVNNENISLTVDGAKSAAGTYTATASCSSVSGGQAKCSNYTLINPSQSFTINKADCSCKINSIPTLEYPSNTASVIGTTSANISYSCTGDGTISVSADANYLTVGTAGTTSARLTAVNYNTSGVSVTVSRSEGTNYKACSVTTNNDNAAATDNHVIINPSKYTISFDVNGGFSDTVPASVIKTYGSTVTLPTQKPKYYGYKFEGWYLNPEGTGTKFEAGGSFSSGITADTTLYAKWTKQTEYMMEYSSFQTDTSTFLRSSLKRNQISSITFIPGFESATGTITDASRDANNTVKMWYGNPNADGYYDVYIGAKHGIVTLSSAEYLFSEMTNLTTITFEDNTYGNKMLLDTSKTTSMYAMFDSGTSLTSLDLSNFDTSNVTNMSYMFGFCSSLTSLDLSSFDTSNVTSMVSVFEDCSSLTSLDLSSFNTSNVTDMYRMFSGCSSLTSLDLSNFDTSNVTSMHRMFSGCSSLTSLDLSSFNTSNVTSMSSMFSGCSSLTSLDLSGFNTSNVTSMVSVFEDCSSLISLDLSGFNTSNVTDMSDMFRDCNSLTSLDLSSFNTSNVTDMSNMFYECESLTSLDLSSFDTFAVTAMPSMFYGVSSLEKITFGEDFIFLGDDGYLPVPDITVFPTNTNGKWYKKSDWKMYSPEELATYSKTVSISGTYVAYPLIISYYEGNYYLDEDLVGVNNDAENSNVPLSDYVVLDQSISSDLASVGWEFGGWTTSNNDTSIKFTSTVDLASDEIQNLISDDGRLDLYAVYRRNLEFYSGSPEAKHEGYFYQYMSPYDSDTYYTAVMTPSLTAISEHKAIGWQDSEDYIYTDGNGSATTSFNAFINPLADNVLHGIYGASGDSTNSTATFYSGNYNTSTGKPSNSTTATIYYYSSDSGCRVTTPSSITSIGGFTALGWRDDTSASTKEFDVNTSVSSCATTYYAVYSKNGTFTGGENKATTRTAVLYYNSSGNSRQTVIPYSVFGAVSGFTQIGYRSDNVAGDATIQYSTSGLTNTKVSATSLPVKWYSVYSKDVPFYSGNSGASRTVTLYYNTQNTYKVTTPTATSISGYTLKGWAADASLSGTYIGNGVAYTSNVDTFHAVYDTNSPVTFYSGVNNSTSVNVAQYYISSLTTLGPPGNYVITSPDYSSDSNMASISGFTKIGWTNSENAGSDVTTFGSYNIPNATLVTTSYYSLYSRNVTFYYGTNKAYSEIATQYYNSNDNYVVKTPTLTDKKIPNGFDSMVGWRGDVNAIYDNDIVSLGSNSNVSSDKFYAVYIKPIYFNSGFENSTHKAMTMVYSSADNYSVDTPSTYESIDGYDIVGWMSNSILPRDLDGIGGSENTSDYIANNVIPIGGTLTDKTILSSSTAFYAIYDTNTNISFWSGESMSRLYGDNNNDGDTNDVGDDPIIQYYSSAQYYLIFAPSYLELESISGFTKVGWRPDTADPITAGGHIEGGYWLFEPSLITTSYYGIYSRNVTFKSGLNGSSSTTGTQYYNSSGNYGVLTPSTIASISDFNIVGWADGDNFVAAGDVSHTSDSLIYAKYSRWVTFYSGIDGEISTTRSQTYLSDNTYQVTTPEFSYIDGYIPDGWSPVNALNKEVLNNFCDANSSCSFWVDKFYLVYTAGLVQFVSGLDKDTSGSSEYYVSNPGNGMYQHYIISTEMASSVDNYVIMGWTKSLNAGIQDGYVQGDTWMITSSPSGGTYYALYGRSVGLYSGLNKSSLDIGDAFYNSYGVYGLNVDSASNISGYEFVGLRTDQNAVNDASVLVTQNNHNINNLTSDFLGTNTTLYALYKRNVTFYSGASNGSNTSVVQYYNTANNYSVTTPSTATQISGYTFNGWGTNGLAPTNIPVAPGAVSNSSSSVFFANYVIDVTFKSGLTSETYVEEETQVYRSASNCAIINVPAIADVTNYTKVGWRFDSVASSDSDITAAQVGMSPSLSSCPSSGGNAYAIYSKDIAFVSGTTTEYVKQYFSSSGNVSDITTPTGIIASQLSGYDALGWRNDTIAADKQYNFNAKISNNTINTYYAVYSRDVDFYSGPDMEEYMYGTQYYNSSGVYNTLMLDSDMVDSNLFNSWIFCGWRDDAIAAAPQVMPGQSSASSSTVYYAIYYRTINFISGEDALIHDGSRTQFYNTNHTVSTVNAPTPSSIINWNPDGYAGDENSYSSLYNYGAEITPAFDDPGLYYAIYKRPYNISYNANGGTGTTTSNYIYYAWYNSAKEDVLLYSGSFTPQTSSFTNECKTLASWNSSADGSGTKYNIGTNIINKNIEFSTAASYGETWYAQWDEDFSCPSYAVYSDTDKSLRFYRSSTPITAGSTYNGRVVTNVYTDFLGGNVPWSSRADDVESVVFEDVIRPGFTTSWFEDFTNTSYFDVRNLDTRSVYVMDFMFKNASMSTETCNIVGVENFVSHNLKNMIGMFMGFCYEGDEINLDLSSWYVYGVKDLDSVFSGMGVRAKKVTLNVSNWNTSNVTNMVGTFGNIQSGFVESIDDLEHLELNIIGLDTWNTSNVTDMDSMFNYTGYKVPNFYLDLSSWDVSNVESHLSFNYNVETKVIAPNFPS